MWNTITLDTRAIDGFIHIVPVKYFDDHWFQISCWCDPRVVWCETLGTLIISHKHKKPPKPEKMPA